MTGSRIRVARSRTSIAMRRLPERRGGNGRAARAGGGRGRSAGAVADTSRRGPRAGCGPWRCWRRRGTQDHDRTVADSAPKYQRKVRNFPDRDGQQSVARSTFRVTSTPAYGSCIGDGEDLHRRDMRAVGSLAAHADVGAVPAHAARRPGRRRGRQPPAARAGRLHPPGRAGIYSWLPARVPGPAQGRGDRPGGDGRGRGPGGAAADRPAARALGAQRPRRRPTAT